MRHQDKVVTIFCVLCGRHYELRVNSKDYEAFNEPTNHKSLDELMPYLTAEDADLLETGVCIMCM